MRVLTGDSAKDSRKPRGIVIPPDGAYCWTHRTPNTIMCNTIWQYPLSFYSFHFSSLSLSLLCCCLSELPLILCINIWVGNVTKVMFICWLLLKWGFFLFWSCCVNFRWPFPLFISSNHKTFSSYGDRSYLSCRLHCFVRWEWGHPSQTIRLRKTQWSGRSILARNCWCSYDWKDVWISCKNDEFNCIDHSCFFLLVSEVLYEDEKFPARKLAALVASKVILLFFLNLISRILRFLFCKILNTNSLIFILKQFYHFTLRMDPNLTSFDECFSIFFIRTLKYSLKVRGWSCLIFSLKLLFCVQVFYHLGDYKEAMDYALKAEEYFDISKHNEYVDTLIGIIHFYVLILKRSSLWLFDVHNLLIFVHYFVFHFLLFSEVHWWIYTTKTTTIWKKKPRTWTNQQRTWKHCRKNVQSLLWRQRI